MIDGFKMSTDSNLIDIDVVHGFLKKSHWAKNRSRETIVKSISHSLCYSVFKSTRQVAFARIVTDYATFAYLCDVYVDEAFRGLGLSKWMMSEIMAHPDLKNLRRFVLATKDAHGLYEKFGFKTLSSEENRRFMSILKENV
jgi:ribosomal protein S18 acetylase RimI-like enzyme